MWCGNGVSAFFGVIVNIFLETGIVLLLLLRSQVASSDRTHTDAIESERDGEEGERQVPARLRNAAAAETTNASEFGIEFGSTGKE